MRDDATEFSESWIRWRRRVDLDEYDRRWDRREVEGADVHGEADFVHRLVVGEPGREGSAASIMDAGCGTGRVAAELARRGHRVIAVDNDPDMLAYAVAKPEPVEWHRANLASVALPDRFDLIVMAGDILVYARPEDRAAVVSNLARHLRPGGALVNGAGTAGGLGVETYDRWCRLSGLVFDHRFGGWDREPYAGGPYAVSVHRSARKPGEDGLGSFDQCPES